MKFAPRKIAIHTIIFVAAIVLISVIGIWFDTGPVVLSP